jgi:mRNA-degrading endonuclease toxin of MazEF toxin-antitoxin module
VVEIPNGAAGLAKTSVAICHQVTTLDRVKLSKRIGSLSASLMEVLGEGLKAALDLD